MAKANLTKRTVESLQIPESGRAEYRDTKTPGLTMIVCQNGNRYWYWLRKVRGRDIRAKIGDYPDLTPERARKQAELFNSRRATGEPISGKITEPTLEELWGEYLERHAKQHKKTWESDQNQYRLYLKQWKKRRLSEITKLEVTRWHSRLGNKSGKYAANRALALLRKMFNFADGTLDWKGRNPCDKVKQFREKSRDRFLSPEELKAFSDAIATEPPAFRDYFTLSIILGQRRQNMLSMRWADVDLEAAIWRIPETKNGEVLYVHLPESAVNILKTRAENRESEFVFPSYGRTGHLVEPKTSWQRVCKTAGLTDVRIHDLRRTLGSYAAMNQSSLTTIGAILGHKSIQATKVYARLGASPVQEAHSQAASVIITHLTTTKKA